jgi:hypothetical protein
MISPESIPSERIHKGRREDGQVAKLLDSVAPYLALVKEGRYHSMIGRGDGERLLIRELLTQFHKGSPGPKGHPAAP